MRKILCGIVAALIVAASLPPAGAYADVATVQEQDQKKYLLEPPRIPAPAAPASAYKDLLETSLTASVTQGVDTNPLLDSTHKADSYTQEMVDLHFRCPLPDNRLGPAAVRFGASALNVNYYEVTDVNIFDGIADVYYDQQLTPRLSASAGYQLEAMWYPNNRDGNYLGNSFIATVKHTILTWLYQRFTYQTEYRKYFDRKIMLGDFTRGSALREDIRNTFRHELGAYIDERAKVRFINSIYVNDSNYEFMDYYDYIAYRTGGSVTAVFTDKLFGTAGFYYQRRNYDSRELSVSTAHQKDNLYVVACSLIYDITKNLSAFLSYSHSENHTNEPLERYSDTLYSGGLSYSF